MQQAQFDTDQHECKSKLIDVEVNVHAYMKAFF